MKRLMVLVALAASLEGCVSWTDPAELRAKDTTDLCSAYASFGSYADRQNAIQAEITRRGLIDLADWDMVRQHRVRIGMTECALLASWGYPIDSHRTVTQGGDETQLVFGACNWGNCSPSRYGYVQNGRVVAIQN
jgi:hypothetical protein